MIQSKTVLSVCPICGAEFQKRAKSHQKYCSKDCSLTANYNAKKGRIKIKNDEPKRKTPLLWLEAVNKIIRDNDGVYRQESSGGKEFLRIKRKYERMKIYRDDEGKKRKSIYLFSLSSFPSHETIECEIPAEIYIAYQTGDYFNYYEYAKTPHKRMKVQ